MFTEAWPRNKWESYIGISMFSLTLQPSNNKWEDVCKAELLEVGETDSFDDQVVY